MNEIICKGIKVSVSFGNSKYVSKIYNTLSTRSLFQSSNFNLPSTTALLFPPSRGDAHTNEVSGGVIGGSTSVSLSSVVYNIKSAGAGISTNPDIRMIYSLTGCFVSFAYLVNYPTTCC